MSRNRFRFIWRYFHCNHPESKDYGDEQDGDNPDDDDDDSINDDGIVIEERVRAEQDNEGDNEGDNENDTSLWFHKVKPLMDHFRKTSQSLIYTLGSILSIDEMMVRFSGRSRETHRMKNKPIRSGFKMFCLNGSDGYSVDSTPDGRTPTCGKEYDDSDSGKIVSMIRHIVGVIGRLKEKQKDRIATRKRVAVTRKRKLSEMESGLPSLEDEDIVIDKHVIAMDNYFTLPGVIKLLRDLCIGIVGTARFRFGWPPKEIRDIDQSSCNFNDFHWTVDKDGTLLGRWMDNALVFMVSTVHKIGENIKRPRRRPRINNNNRNHVNNIWGDKGKQDIYIPRIIDDYNHWMGGVDLADQRIAYYHPDLRCHRTWVPLFLQLLSMIRNNMYIVYHDYYSSSKKSSVMTHKEFILAMIEHFLELSAKAEEESTTTAPVKNITMFSPLSTASQISGLSQHTPATRSNSSINTTEKKKVPPARSTDGITSLHLYHQRLDTPRILHARATSNKRAKCVYCSMLFNDKKKEKSVNWDQFVKRTKMTCHHCRVHLCTKHFDEFHEEN